MKKVHTINGQYNITDALYETIVQNNTLMEEENNTDNVDEGIEVLKGLLNNNEQFKQMFDKLTHEQKEALKEYLLDKFRYYVKDAQSRIDKMTNKTQWDNFLNNKELQNKFIETYLGLSINYIKELNTKDINDGSDGYTINYEFPNTKKVMIEYFSKYQDKNYFSKFNSTENRDSIKKQQNFIKNLKTYISNAMNSMGRSQMLADYIFTTGKTEYSLNYEREKKDDRTYLNDLSDRLIGQSIIDDWETNLKSKVFEAVKKDVTITDPEKARLDINNNKITNEENQNKEEYTIINMIADTFYKFFKGWFYKFTETLTDTNVLPFSSKYSSNAKDNTYVYYCIDFITYEICRGLFFVSNNQTKTNDRTPFGNYILESRKNNKIETTAFNLFYLNVVCFNKDTYDDIYDYFISRPSIKNADSELFFETKKVKRVRNVNMKTIQVYVQHNRGRRIMLCNLDIIYLLSKAKPFIKDLQHTINKSFSKFKSGSGSNKL